MIEKLKAQYGKFFEVGELVQADWEVVPDDLLELIPYAMFWGVSDDLKREELVSAAPQDVCVDLKNLIAKYDDALDCWLAGPEAMSENPTEAYVAFSAMRMGADFM